MVLVSYFSDLKQIVYEFFSLNLNIFIFQKKTTQGQTCPIHGWMTSFVQFLQLKVENETYN